MTHDPDRNPPWIRRLKKLGACEGAVEWAKTQPSPEAAWASCHRGDWMLWIVGQFVGGPGSDLRRPLVLAACECARLALPHVRPGEDRPRLAIETAERWARREGATLRDVLTVADAAEAAYTGGYATEAAAAAAEAAYACVYAAAYAAAAEAAYACVYAAAYAAAAAAEAAATTHRQCADIVRKHYPDWQMPEDGES
jgi:hypothetical protein